MTGATGFVGRRLATALSRDGVAVRALARRPEAVDVPGVEVAAIDLDSGRGLAAGLAGCGTAYYLVHSMGQDGDFADLDRRRARRFASAAARAKVEHVVYLGGLHPRGVELSAHLESRREVGEILRDGCGATTLRAGMVIGPGSASWRILRDLSRRLPLMLTPEWTRTRSQPTHVDDVVAALRVAPELGDARVLDAGGPDVVTYEEMMRRVAGVNRRGPVVMVPAPVLTPSLSSWWLVLVTSVPLALARDLVDSLRFDLLADGDDVYAEAGITPMGFDAAVAATLAEERSSPLAPLGVEVGWLGRAPFNAASQLAGAARRGLRR